MTKQETGVKPPEDPPPSKPPEGDPDPKGEKDPELENEGEPTVPMSRFTSQNHELQRLRKENEALKSGDPKGDPPAPGPNARDLGDEVTHESIAKMLEANNAKVMEQSKNMFNETIASFSQVMTGNAADNELQELKKTFGEDFDESRDLPEIQKIQELHPSVPKDMAFRALQSHRNEIRVAEANGRAEGYVDSSNGARPMSMGVSGSVPDDVRRLVDESNARNPNKKTHWTYKSYMEAMAEGGK